VAKTADRRRTQGRARHEEYSMDPSEALSLRNDRPDEIPVLRRDTTLDK
jgi:hypothetical protein